MSPNLGDYFLAGLSLAAFAMSVREIVVLLRWAKLSNAARAGGLFYLALCLMLGFAGLWKFVSIPDSWHLAFTFWPLALILASLIYLALSFKATWDASQPGCEQ